MKLAGLAQTRAGGQTQARDLGLQQRLWLSVIPGAVVPLLLLALLASEPMVALAALALVPVAAAAVAWAVHRALRPLAQVADALSQRSRQDLGPIDESRGPPEVRPMIAALNRMFSLVKEQAEGQRRFVADAAHQLRTPLAALQSQVEAWAEALHGGPSVVLSAEQIERLLGAARRTTQLANQLLALSRADARTSGVLPMERIDVKALCESLLEDFLETAVRRQIDLGLDVMPVAVAGQGWLLRELLSNLVDNALKYTPAGGTVTLRCGKRPGGVRLEVEDDGPGVPASALPRLFDRFYRVPGAPGEGTGLGLAIAQEIARSHRSVLRAQPGSGGRGLRMTVDLPALPGFRGAG